jgi:hypothetical protein
MRPQRSITLDDVREVARGLPRAYEVTVRGRVKFRVEKIVWLAFSQDESVMGFAFPKAWRQALIDTAPDKFKLPRPSDLKFNWVEVRLDALDREEMRELVIDAWAMVVPKYVVDEHLQSGRP